MPLLIAVTGATGFVGRAVLPRLLAEGHSLRVLVRDPSKLAQSKDVHLVKGGLDDAPALFELVAGADVVLHMAGAISALNRDGFFKVNETGSLAVAQAAQAAGAKRLILMSSLAARRPELSAYGASKRAAEDAVKSFRQTMQLLILRPSAVYGPGDTATLPLLSALMQRDAILPGRSSNRFSMIHVDDLAKICTEAVSSTAAGLFEVDDAGGGYCWDDLANVVRAHFGRPRRLWFLPYGLMMVVGHAFDIYSKLSGKSAMLSADKVRELYEPDWVAQGANWPRDNPLSLFDGLPDTIRWYQEHGLLPRVAMEGATRHGN